MTDDDDLLDRLRRIAAEVDGVPDLVQEAARAAFLTRRLDDEIATLLGDPDTSAVTVRGPAYGPRRWSYEFGEVSLELEFDVAAGRLRGLAVGAVDEVEVEIAGGDRRSSTPDDLGWFTVESLPVGPVRVRVRAEDGTPVTTGWLLP